MRDWQEFARQGADFIAKKINGRVQDARASYERNEIDRRTRLLDWRNPKAKKSNAGVKRSRGERLTWASCTLFFAAMPTLIVALH